MKNWLFSDGKQKLLEGFCCISMGWVVKVESKKKSAAMKWFPLHKTKVLGGAPDISLGQKYLTTADPFDPNYNTPDQHRDLKKLTCPSAQLAMTLQVCPFWNCIFFYNPFSTYYPMAHAPDNSPVKLPYRRIKMYNCTGFTQSLQSHTSTINNRVILKYRRRPKSICVDLTSLE